MNVQTCAACEARCGQLHPEGSFYWDLCINGTATAAQGPKRGTPLKDLCQAVVSCVRQNMACLFWNADDPGTVQPCWCGMGVGDLQCLSGQAVGPCEKPIEDAAEISTPAMAPEEIATRLTDPNYALGAATNLIQECDRVYCRTSCLGLPGGDAIGGASGASGAAGTGGGAGTSSGAGTGGRGGTTGIAGTSGGAGTLGVAGAGGRGGTTGTAGTGAGTAGTGGGGGTGGSAGTGGGPAGTGGGGTTYEICHMCEMTQCPDALALCENAEGTAASGTGMGRPRRDLCLDVMACIRRTQCARDTDGEPGNEDAQRCYCGTASDFACLAGTGANGPCKPEIEAAAESQSSEDVGIRFTLNVSHEMEFPIAFATSLQVCDAMSCRHPLFDG